MDILYEDNHLIAVNKRAGEIVHGDKTGDLCMADAIKLFLKERDHKPGNVFCGVIHRLDRPVSGVVLFAKTSKALARMNAMVQQREFHKTYWAIVHQAPNPLSGSCDNWLVRNERLNKSFVCDEHTQGAKRALLDYRVVATSKGGYHLVEVQLHTGRHHQIRCQLAHLGCPIKGDLKYGAPRSNADGSISLNAHSIEFFHPISHQTVLITAPWSEIERFR
ncbi:MAG: RluA family pseudouridine synthase [Bacteroidales bacterium]|nr:RluA family pseudouridine synthase [Candidatus Colimorpha onthohippi]